MDGLTLAAAALAIAVEQSRDAALRQAVLERERLAMAVEDRDSVLAQRFFARSVQLPSPQGRPQTWQAAYEVRDDNFEQVVDALREVRAANRHGDGERIEVVIARELGDSSDEAEGSADEAEGSADEAEGSSDEEPAAHSQPAPPPTHRCVLCGSTRNLSLLLPTGRWASLPMEQRLVCDDCLDAAE